MITPLNILLHTAISLIWRLDGAKFEFAYNRIFSPLNFWRFQKKLALKVDEIDGAEFYTVSDGELSITLNRKRRLRYYRRGIARRLGQLARDYRCFDIKFSPGDVLIDCGANIGEFGMHFTNSFDDVTYIAFEPSELEAVACDINHFDGEKRTNRAALWNEDGTLEFFHKNDTGDSSLFEMHGHSGSTTVPTLTLESVFRQHKLKHVKLLKLEAEGAEPEILNGGLKVLQHIQYIAIDGGFEKGFAEEATVVPCTNILTQNGFKLLDFNHIRHTLLFENRNFK